MVAPHNLYLVAGVPCTVSMYKIFMCKPARMTDDDFPTAPLLRFKPILCRMEFQEIKIKFNIITKVL